jgi:hypothetical protein
MRDYDEAIRLDPNYAYAYHSRGTAYRKQGDVDRAIRDFGEAIRSDPKYVFAYRARAFAYGAKKDNDRAIRDFDEAIRLDPADVEIYAFRGLARRDRGDRAGAVADFKAVLARPEGANKWAHNTARRELAALENGPVQAPQPQIAAAPQPAPQVAALPPVPLGRRVALVIGNAAYPGAARLANPVNDATDVAAALRRVGFDVIEGKDLTLSGFAEKVAAFRDKAADADVALFYYAGHGMQFDDQNWLLPVDGHARSVFEARRQYISLTEAIAEVESRAGATLVFLDACRNNPLEDELKASFRSLGRGAADTRGLTRVDIKSPQTLVVFSTRANTVAIDGAGRNSPFTEAFLQHLATAGVEIEVLMKRVSATVAQKTNGKQQPERLSRLEREFYFVPVAQNK